jgi:hypothetical protein
MECEAWLLTRPKPAPMLGVRSGVTIDAAFKSLENNVVIDFQSATKENLLRGAFWLYKDVLYELDYTSGGTLINGRYDDLVYYFWEPRVKGGRGVLSGTSDVLKLDCGLSQKIEYTAVSKQEIDGIRERIENGDFKIVPITQQKPHTPCDPIVGNP